MEEIWKPIKNYENYYEISNLGRVRSLDRVVKQGNHTICRKGCIKKQRIDPNGYPVVTLCKNKKSVSNYVHRLIAEAFIPNINNKMYVDHINTITTDNRIENLRWVTTKENSNNPLTIKHMITDAINKNSIKKRLISRKQNKTKTGPKTVYQYTPTGTLINEYFSIAETSKALNCSPTYIRKLLNTNKLFHNTLLTTFYKEGV